MSGPIVAASAGANGAPALALAWQRAESLCIKCGFCLPACPTYRETGHEAASPRGRLELMYRAAQGRLEVPAIEDALSLCLGCLACETACPSGIRFHDMLDAARIDAAAVRRRRGGGRRSTALLGLLLAPRRLRAVAWALYAFQRSGLRMVLGGHGLLRVLWPRLARLERRAPPIPAPRRWRAAARAYLAPQPTPGESPGKPVALFSGCVMDTVFGAVHVATARVLHANGYAVNVPPDQVCCGALHHHTGEVEAARALARRNIAAFEALGDAPLAVNSAGCGALLKDYGTLLADDPAWAERARRFSARVRDACELLAAEPLRTPPRAVPLRVAYDDACHLLHAQRIREEPRHLLTQVPGLELVPLEEADACCGSAGSYSLVQPEMAARVLARKMGHVRASGAQVVATGNPGCLLQLALGARETRLPVRVAHPLELVAEAYD